MKHLGFAEMSDKARKLYNEALNVFWTIDAVVRPKNSAAHCYQ